MNYSIEEGPSYAVLDMELDQGESIVADGGVMTWMSNLGVKTNMTGGLLSGIKRVVGGESLFLNTYTAESGRGSITMAPGDPGMIVDHDLSGDLYLQKSAFICCQEGVTTDLKFQGLRGFFNVGLVSMRLTGEGKVFFGSYGDVEAIDVDGDIIIDNGHVVAWEPTLQYELSYKRGVRNFLFSEGMMLRFHGTGRIWVQSRNPLAVADFMYPFRPVKRDNN
ncbi:MAG: TIGR00266 family protein [Phycisphaerae bacterium]|nr:TIGR00266 family protein [Phycisphaerae bacterium]